MCGHRSGAKTSHRHLEARGSSEFTALIGEGSLFDGAIRALWALRSCCGRNVDTLLGAVRRCFDRAQRHLHEATRRLHAELGADQLERQAARLANTLRPWEDQLLAEGRLLRSRQPLDASEVTATAKAFASL